MLDIRLTFAQTLFSPLIIRHLFIVEASNWSFNTFQKKCVTTPANSEDIWHVLTFEAIKAITNFCCCFCVE